MSEYDQIRESLFIEHFKLRTNPKSYIPHLEEQMKFFRDNISDIRQSLYHEFKGLLDDVDFDLYTRRAIMKYQGDF